MVAGSLLQAADTVAIETNVTFQTVRAWGAPTGGLVEYSDSMIAALLDEMVFSMGLTRARLEPPRRGHEDPLNDNGDPFATDPSAFSTAELDDRVRRLYLPLKRRVEECGERFEWYLSPSFFNNGSTGSAPAWLLNDPGEYTEWYLAVARHLRRTFDLQPQFFVICNEAANDNAFTTPVVATLIKTLAPRLEALGFTGTFQFPESVSADTAWNAIQSVPTDAELWRWIGLASYHLYGGNNSRPNIRDFALARNLPTAQTEYIGLTLNILYDDLVLGGVSRWETYAMNDFLSVNSSQTWFSRNATYWQLRQVTRFVRPGSVRVAATATGANLRALAFVRQDTMTAVLLNTSGGGARNVDVSGMFPGSYARSQVIGATHTELGPVNVPPSGVLSVNLPANAVLTLYPHGGTNHPPVVQNWSASPPFLTRPASSVNLSAAGVDPELGSVAYAWTVLDQPQGATVALTAPGSANCPASGMTVAGAYVFQIAFDDGTNRVTRTLPVTVWATNQAPEIRDLHNRRPVQVILPANATTLRGFAFDPEGDTPSYQWTIQSQPAGAAAVLVNPGATSCLATNLDLPGTYLFRLTVRAGSHTVQAEHTVVVQPANQPPVIDRASAAPAALTLPAQATTLDAAAHDPDQEAISHWWSLLSGPAGARPVFSSQGSNHTTVRGLVLPGSYAFRLTVVDRAAFANRTVNVTVDAGTNPPLLFLAAPVGGETFVSGQRVWIRWAAHNLVGEVKLEWFDGIQWRIVADSTPNDGAEPWPVPHGAFPRAKIRVSSVSNPAVSDESATEFSIAAETPRFVDWRRGDGGAIELQFAQYPGMINRLQRSRTLASNDWETLGSFNGQADEVRFTDTGAASAPRGFFRVASP